MDSISKLYDIVKPLYNDIPIYKEVMTEDKDSTPKSYMLIVSDITNTGDVYGDGKAITRQANCDIHLISKGTAQNSNCVHNKNKRKIDALLDNANIDYVGVNLGFNDTHKYTEYVWSVTVYG